MSRSVYHEIECSCGLPCVGKGRGQNGEDDAVKEAIDMLLSHIGGSPTNIVTYDVRTSDGLQRTIDHLSELLPGVQFTLS